MVMTPVFKGPWRLQVVFPTSPDLQTSAHGFAFAGESVLSVCHPISRLGAEFAFQKTKGVLLFSL